MLFRSTLAAGGGGGGLAPLIEMVNQLGALAKPYTSDLLFTTYPHFFGGQIKCDLSTRKKAGERVEQDLAFQDHFTKPICRDSLRAMIENSDDNQDGGVGFVFETLGKSVDPNRKPRLLTQRAALAREKLIALLQDQLPSADGAQRNTDIDSVCGHIHSYIANSTCNDPSIKISHQIRRLVNVDFTSLDDIPSNAKRQRLQPYVDKQLKNWMDSKRNLTNLDEIGLNDPILRSRFLSYLVDDLNTRGIAQWIANELGNLVTQDE